MSCGRGRGRGIRGGGVGQLNLSSDSSDSLDSVGSSVFLMLNNYPPKRVYQYNEEEAIKPSTTTPYVPHPTTLKLQEEEEALALRASELYDKGTLDLNLWLDKREIREDPEAFLKYSEHIDPNTGKAHVTIKVLGEVKDKEDGGKKKGEESKEENRNEGGEDRKKKFVDLELEEEIAQFIRSFDYL